MALASSVCFLSDFTILRSFSEVGPLLYLSRPKRNEIVMKYVYILQSIFHPNKRYIGITKDLNKRLKNHNAGESPHTSKYKPWKLVVAIKFYDDKKADAFERYLKSGSGHPLQNVIPGRNNDSPSIAHRRQGY